ncbi:cryptochrome/photolyase family protein [Halioxenophilus aromaticivorans]|uniref:Deoxyribodipyrimidine photo-lyase n=1 Tax=Halioxenophilus aromaticivorans TaxID=1306992 RepID=A0AAV3U556_9ALTE
MAKLPSNAQLVWLRNDLRLNDNPALYHASTAGPVVACFAVCEKQWQEHRDAPAKLGLAQALLTAWAEDAEKLGIVLKIVHAPMFSDAPKAITALAQEIGAQGVWWNKEYPLNEMRRDKAVRQACEQADLAVHEYDGDVVLAPGTVTNGSGDMYQVFTPFSKRWRQVVTEAELSSCPRPGKQTPLKVKGDSIPGFGGEYRADLWPAQRDKIQRNLHNFCSEKLAEYSDTRDIPAHRGTSLISPYLALGALGIRHCIEQVQKDQGPDGFHGQWVTELIWREFYRHLMAAKPRLSMGKCFRPDGEKVQWAKPEYFEDWRQGKTGVPIVDAGMRQLLQTGWMHNRVRMIVAAFLSKLMLVDWHLGEQHFMAHLIDGDFASNNGGWQWSASVGADAAPYFRIFNPYRQAEKFDPNGDYVRKFVPELQSITDKKIHQPSEQQCRALGYPLPIINYKVARSTAMDVFAKAFKG